MDQAGRRCDRHDYLGFRAGGFPFWLRLEGYGFGVYSDGRLFLTKVGISVVALNPGITDTNIHHVAVTKNGSTVVFYIDGVAYGVPAYNSGGFVFSTPAVIGARGDTLRNTFWGTIDELSVYSRPLSTNEIQAIYDANISGKCVVLVPPVIVSHPRNTNAIAGANVTLSVVAGGSSPLSYQWRFNGTNIVNANGSGSR